MSEHVHEIRQLSSRVAYENPWTRVREDEIVYPDGSEGMFGVVEKPDFALVIPFTGDGFHLVEQYRYPIRKRSWEFPAGAVYDGARRDPEMLAHLELEEETGITATSMRHLGMIHPMSAIGTQTGHVFLATGLMRGEARREHTEQGMHEEWKLLADFEQMIAMGEVTDASTLAAYMLFKLHVGSSGD